MSYFLFNGIIDPEQNLIIRGSEFRHIKLSRRIQIDEVITIQDSKQNRYTSSVIGIRKDHIELKILEIIIPPEEPTFNINLYQALIKEKQLDLVIQKTTELGVKNIYVFQSNFSQKIKSDEINRKLTRWNKIAFEACKQSDRAKPPKIYFFKHLNTLKTETLDNQTIYPVCILSTEQKDQRNKMNITDTGINLFVGPEGGLSPQEIKTLNGYKLNLGPRIMKSETAAIVAVAIFQFQFGDMKTFP